MKFVIRPVAREDILRQYRYYLIEKDAESVAGRFLDAVRVAMESVRKRPRAGTPKAMRSQALAGLRSWLVKGFAAMRIYYLVLEGEVRVIRVLHGKRDVDVVLRDDG